MVHEIIQTYYRNTQILDKLAIFFNNNLLQHTDSLNYLLQRGISKKAIEEFRIGYDINALSLQTFIEKENISLESLSEIGVLTKNEDNSYYDRFADRIIFPILDIKGLVASFSGRVWQESDERAKYINGSLSSTYQKSLTLFGLFQALYDIQKNNLVLVTEGNVDVITCHVKDIKIAVATCGSAFTKEHFQLLKMFVNRFIFCFDNDESGRKSTEKVKGLLKDEKTIKVGYLNIEGVKDLDLFIQVNGAAKLKEIIKEFSNELVF
jgi:DNA primase